MEKQNGLIFRRILVFLLAAMALSVTSCADSGTEAEELYSVKIELQPTVEPVKTPDLQPAVMPIQTPDNPLDNPSDRNQKAETYQMEDWEKAYLEYLESYEGKDKCTYTFIYVDDDSIPELEINTVGSSLLLTYHDGILDEVDIYRSGLYYIERGNLVCNRSGNMDSYFDFVYTIQEGHWKQIGCGEYWLNYENSTEDYIDYIYEWDGESVTEEEYEQKLQDIYPEEESKEPEGHYYIYKDISSLLKTGAVASANHYYKLVEADMTWTEAEAACRKWGGYLATITSWEEFERIQEQIIQEEKTDIAFWIGAARRGAITDFYCLEPGMDLGYSMLSLYKALWSGFWWEKPRLIEADEGAEEGFVMMRYSSDDGRYYYWDIPDDILAVRPTFTGKIGYICEYDGWRELPGMEQVGEWGKAYLEYLDSYDDRDSAKYAFIYVDDDDIPELVVDSGWALNSKVLSFHDNTVSALETYRFGIRYVEKEGLLVNSGSHMWEGFEIFYALRDGQWEQIGFGKMHELDELGNEGRFFEWEEKIVAEGEYIQRVKSIYPVEKEKLPAYLYKFDELHFILGGE
ncbi:MAG: C-type lectin domain-containing protein [Lachnospiraceae bacterium]|nr:C-type lectin domain-containing protein [Lachnospiraceae bacterium]